MSYEVLKNRLTNGKPFALDAALKRINALGNQLVITQEQVDELTKLAEQNASNSAFTIEERIAHLEEASLEHDTALMELAAMIGGMA